MLLLAATAIGFGFLQEGVDNFAHIGGFLGGIAVFSCFCAKMSKAVDKLWITCGVIPQKAVDKGVFIPRKIMQYKMNIMICRKIKGIFGQFCVKKKKTDTISWVYRISYPQKYCG